MRKVLSQYNEEEVDNFLNAFLEGQPINPNEMIDNNKDDGPPNLASRLPFLGVKNEAEENPSKATIECFHRHEPMILLQSYLILLRNLLSCAPTNTL